MLQKKAQVDAVRSYLYQAYENFCIFGKFLLLNVKLFCILRRQAAGWLYRLRFSYRENDRRSSIHLGRCVCGFSGRSKLSSASCPSSACNQTFAASFHRQLARCFSRAVALDRPAAILGRRGSVWPARRSTYECIGPTSAGSDHWRDSGRTTIHHYSQPVCDNNAFIPYKFDSHTKLGWVIGSVV